MTNRNDNRKQPHTGSSNAAVTEFSEEFLSKKARKKAARANKNS